MARRRVAAAIVELWGRDVGGVSWNENRGVASFQYTPEFSRSGLQLAPLHMPLDPDRIFTFTALNRQTFRGLPGLLADALPDRFGNALIDIWLRRQGRGPAGFSPVERLCYMGTRALGALEFRPALGPRQRASERLDVARLADLADQVLQARAKLRVNLKHDGTDALGAIIRVGTSAGGARAKAVIAWNPHTHEVRSGQVPAPPGFEHWLLKFDTAGPTALGDPAGFGRIEFAYHLMAAAAGIDMSPCRLLEEGGRAHFMTRRFDRTAAGGKLHMQSLCALGHYDFNAPGEYGYEQALALLQQLRLPHPDLERLYRRMVFNVLARNQDDHTRNIALLMDPAGTWRLAPAFDVIWSFNAHGRWTNQHQMRVNGKTDGFTRADLLAVAQPFALKSARHILAEVRAAVARWPAFAAQAGVPRAEAHALAKTHRLAL